MYSPEWTYKRRCEADPNYRIKTREWNKAWNERNPDRKRWRDARLVAKRRGIIFELTIEQHAALWGGKCVYGDGQARGIDRRDNSKGYTVENSFPCCVRHNQIKGEFFTHEEMLTIVNTIPSAKACGHINLEPRRGKGDEQCIQ